MSFLVPGIGLGVLKIAVMLSSFCSLVPDKFVTFTNCGGFYVGNKSCCVTPFHKHNLKSYH